MKSPKKEGQILVLMALLSTTLIILFGMVVGIGHLVQAKINLQNAVDLAAMSGASWQARYLDHIGLINYRMRQNYKFAVYDIYVTQSRFNTGLIKGVNKLKNVPFGRLPDSSKEFTFGICQQAYNWHPQPGSGVTGDGVDSGTDLCQLIELKGRSLPPITPSLVPNLDPILIAANLAIIALENTRQDLCKASSGQNTAYFKEAMRDLRQRQDFQFQQLIKVMNDFDQAFSQTDDLSKGKGIADQTIVKTFVSNLIAANRGSMKVEYLNPAATRAFRDNSGPGALAAGFNNASMQGSFVEYFQRQRATFQTYAADFNNCKPSVLRTETSAPVNLGISRARNSDGEESIKIPFSVVLKATVTPNLLFWPRALTPTLVAVAAAKPFGSRIGPSVRMSNIEVAGQNSSDEITVGGLANMSFYPGDVASNDGFMSGIGHGTVLRALMSVLPKPGGSNGEPRLRPSIENPAGGLKCLNSGGPLPFLCLSLAPTLYEGLFWNVYPYPPQKYAADDPSIQAEFPWDLQEANTARVPGAGIIQTADENAYFLADRMASRSHGSEVEKWHETVLIGDSKEFVNDGCPAFFANQVSVASSWSPDMPQDKLVHCPKENLGRRGYQIKLVSLKQVCDEIKEGHSPLAMGQLSSTNQSGASLLAYCEDSDLKVSH